jgi:hypothetical protein
VGLFGRGADGQGEPIAAIRRGKVAAAHVSEGILTLKIVTSDGEALIEVPGRAQLSAGGRTFSEAAPEFPSAVGELLGAKVLEASIERGQTIKLDFGKAGTLVISLVEGDYPGTRALFLKGPGKTFVSYHCDGATKLTM